MKSCTQKVCKYRIVLEASEVCEELLGELL